MKAKRKTANIMETICTYTDKFSFKFSCFDRKKLYNMFIYIVATAMLLFNNIVITVIFIVMIFVSMMR